LLTGATTTGLKLSGTVTIPASLLSTSSNPQGLRSR
jgi:hypothetical protein